MANEKRLIDANALIADTYILNGWDAPIIRAWVADQPTVDAVEVVHGRWVCLEAEIGYFACSECDHRILRAKCNYCPNCGAKMDGDGNGT